MKKKKISDFLQALNSKGTQFNQVRHQLLKKERIKQIEKLVPSIFSEHRVYIRLFKIFIFCFCRCSPHPALMYICVYLLFARL